MALIACPECGKKISAEARACPACGFPLLQTAGDTTSSEEQTRPMGTVENTQTVLLEVRPSWWNYGWHLLFSWLLIPLVVALYRRHSFVMRIYSDRVSVEEGFWSTETSEFFIKDIRSIDVLQGFWGRLVGIGSVLISTAATVESSEEAHGVRQPEQIKELLISRRQHSNT